MPRADAELELRGTRERADVEHGSIVRSGPERCRRGSVQTVAAAWRSSKPRPRART